MNIGNRFIKLLMMQSKDRKPLMARVEIKGRAVDVMNDIARIRPRRAESLIYLTIRVKSTEGNWDCNYELPVISGADTAIHKRTLDTLRKQGRITVEECDKAMDMIDALSHAGNEAGYNQDRYASSSLSD